MYAIIAADGRQYKVQTGDEIQVDLREDAKEGTRSRSTTCCWFLAPRDKGWQAESGRGERRGGSPEQEMGDKIYIQKMRRRKNFRRRTGIGRCTRGCELGRLRRS